MALMKLKTLGVCAVLAALATSAPAAIVSYVPTGVFGGGTLAGTSSYNSGTGDEVDFTPTAATGLATPSFVSFGSFSTLATSNTAGPGTVSSPFTLTITQSSPTAGSTIFTAALTGTLTVTSSAAYLQFASPLSGNVGGIQYAITAADGGIAGRLNLAPPTTGGVVALPGYVSAVPEPTMAVLAGFGVMALARRRRATVA